MSWHPATLSSWGAILVPALLAGEGRVQVTTPCDKQSAPVDSESVQCGDDDATNDENFCVYSRCYWVTGDELCYFYPLCYWPNTAYVLVTTASVLVQRLIVGALLSFFFMG